MKKKRLRIAPFLISAILGLGGYIGEAKALTTFNVSEKKDNPVGTGLIGGSFRDTLVNGSSSACHILGDANLSFDLASFNENTPHIRLKRGIVLSNCESDSITIDGAIQKQSNYGNLEVVIDGSEIPTGECALTLRLAPRPGANPGEVLPPTKVTIKNITFIGTKGAAICVDSDPSARIEIYNSEIGKTRFQDCKVNVNGDCDPNGSVVAPNTIGIAINKGQFDNLFIGDTATQTINGQTFTLGNRITNNSNSGISIEAPATDPNAAVGPSGRIIGNTISNNGGSGLFIRGNNSIIQNNFISSNASSGVYMTGTAQRNTVGNLTTDPLNMDKGNQIFSNKAAGVKIDSNGAGNNISRNQIKNNTGLGIDLKGSNDAAVNNFISLFVDGSTGPNFLTDLVSTPEDIRVRTNGSNGKYIYSSLLKVKNSNPANPYRVELYGVDSDDLGDPAQVRKMSNPAGQITDVVFGEGETFIPLTGSSDFTIADLKNGRFAIPFDTVLQGAVSSTISFRFSSLGNTSEFSGAVDLPSVVTCTPGDVDCPVSCPTGSASCPPIDQTACVGKTKTPHWITGLTSTLSQDRKQITLGWTDASDNEDGFFVERAIGNPDGTCTGVTNFVRLTPDVNSNATEKLQTGRAVTFTDIPNPAPTVGTNYCYRVLAFNFIPGSSTSEICDAQTSRLQAVTVTRDDPPGITADPQNPYNYNVPKVTVTITDNSQVEDGFCIRRSGVTSKACDQLAETDFTEFVGEITTTTKGETGKTYTYDDPNVINGARYCYIAYNKVGASCVNKSTPDDVLLPLPPGQGDLPPVIKTDLPPGFDPKKDPPAVIITITDTSKEEDGFCIRRTAAGVTCDQATKPEDFKFIGEITSDTKTEIGKPYTYTDKDVQNGQTYCYVATNRKNGVCEPKDSNKDGETIPTKDGETPPVIVVTPRPDKDKDKPGNTTVIITDQWDKETGFCVERVEKPCALATDADFNSPTAHVGTVKSTTTSGTGAKYDFNDPTAEKDKTYCYRVKNELSPGVCSENPSNKGEILVPSQGTGVIPGGGLLEGSGLHCSFHPELNNRFNIVGILALMASLPALFFARFRTARAKK